MWQFGVTSENLLRVRDGPLKREHLNWDPKNEMELGVQRIALNKSLPFKKP